MAVRETAEVLKSFQSCRECNCILLLLCLNYSSLMRICLASEFLWSTEKDEQLVMEFYMALLYTSDGGSSLLQCSQ